MDTKAMNAREPKRVLLLEDELLIVMDLEIIVENYGCAVVGPARTCASAIELLKSHKVDVAIIDLIIGDERCDVVADELDARGIPWALSTGFAALDLRYGAVPLISKPYFQSEVHLVLRDLLDALAT